MSRSRGSGGLRGNAEGRKQERVGTGGWKGWGTRRGDAELSTGMTGMRHQEPFASVGVATLLLLLTWGVSGSQAMARPPLSQLQDIQPEEWNIAELAELLANAEPQERERKLANIVEWMHQLRQQQLQQLDEAEMESDGNTRMAVPPPLVHGAASGMRHDEDNDDKGKRGSFMSLCHFKICNMGRKRNLRYNPIARA